MGNKKRSKLLVLLLVLVLVFSLLPSTFAATAGTPSAGTYNNGSATIKVVVKDSSGQGISGQSLTLSAVTNTTGNNKIVTSGLTTVTTDNTGTATFTIGFNSSRNFGRNGKYPFELKISAPASSTYTFTPNAISISGNVTSTNYSKNNSLNGGTWSFDATSNGYFTATLIQTAPTITTTSLSNGTVNSDYNQTLKATGTTPITWSATGLPEGLSLDPATGVISGKPTGAGTFTVDITASNGISPNAQTTLTLTIAEAPTLSGLEKTLTQTSTPGVMDVSLTVNGMSQSTSASANYTIVIDKSTSMNRSVGSTGQNRLEVVKSALLGTHNSGSYTDYQNFSNDGVLKQIFDSSEQGKINVCIISFNSRATFELDTTNHYSDSYETCAAAVASITISLQGTNYIESLAFATTAMNGAPTADYNNFIFLSDGEPYNSPVANAETACKAFASGDTTSVYDSYSAYQTVGSAATKGASRFSIAFATDTNTYLSALSNYKVGDVENYVLSATDSDSLKEAFNDILKSTTNLSNVTISDPLSNNVSYSSADGVTIAADLSDVKSGIVVQTADITNGVADWNNPTRLEETTNYTVTDNGITLIAPLPSNKALKLTFPVKIEDSVYNDYYGDNVAVSYLSNGKATITGSLGTDSLTGEYTNPTFTVPYTDLTLTKKSDSGSILSGAEFVLERVAGYDGTAYSPSTTKTSKSTSEENSVAFSNLTPGTYKITETPPTGYNKLFTEFVFTLTENPTTTTGSNDASLMNANTLTMTLVSLTDKDGNSVTDPKLDNLSDYGINIVGVNKDTHTVDGSKTVDITGYIINTPSTMQLKLNKQSGSTTGTYLAGAEFKVYSNEACTDLIGSVTSTVNGDDLVVSEGTTPLDLTLGTPYYIQETKAPTGMALNNTLYQITLKTDGSSIAVKDSAGNWTAVTEGKLPTIVNATGNASAKVTFANYTQTPLPLTGGSSNQWYMIAGLVALAGGGILIFRCYVTKRTGGRI